MGDLVTALWSIQFCRPEAEAPILLKSGVKAVRFFVGKLAVFLGPFGKELPQLLHSVSTLDIDLGFHFFVNRFDAHGLTFRQADWAIENNHAVLHVADV